MDAFGLWTSIDPDRSMAPNGLEKSIDVACRRRRGSFECLSSLQGVPWRFGEPAHVVYCNWLYSFSSRERRVQVCVEQDILTHSLVVDQLRRRLAVAATVPQSLP